MRLKDVIEYVNGNPKAGNTWDLIKKELRNMKVVENQEELFRKENSTYVRSNDSRIRYDNLRNV